MINIWASWVYSKIKNDVFFFFNIQLIMQFLYYGSTDVLKVESTDVLEVSH